MILALYFPLFQNTVVVLGPSSGPSTPEVTDQIHQFGNVQAGLYPPSLIEDLVREPRMLENLIKLDHIGYGGAPLGKWAGDILCHQTNLRVSIGSTENSVWATVLMEDDEEWDSFQFHPYMGGRLDDLGHGIHELVLERRPELEMYQHVFMAFPELTEFRTKDLWGAHPTKADTWKYLGRVDDLVLLTGEVKFYATAMENQLQEHPLIRSAVIGGAGKTTPFLLVELYTKDEKKPDSTEKEGSALFSEIWQAVENVNKLSPNGVGINKEHILILSPNEPLLRLGKGSVDRRGSLERYSDIIESLYE
jgi:hypothetical protein